MADGTDGVPRGAPGAGSPEGEELWRFALAFYGRPGVEKALLALQDERGLDVSLLIFALWHGASGRGPLGSEGLGLAEERVAFLRDEVVRPLRAVRRRLATGTDPDLRALYDGLKALELAAEKVELARLALLSRPRREFPAAEALADAAAGLAQVFGGEAEGSAEAETVLQALAAFLAGA
jgi:uncharacterized protein (TIGR02444 family)